MTHSSTRTIETIETFEGSELPEALSSASATERHARWSVDRALWGPRTLVARDASGEPLGAALTTGRPYTAYRKIVDIVATDDAVFAALLSAITSDTPEETIDRPAPLVVHFEEHLATQPLTALRRSMLRDAGFDPVPQPAPSIPSTRVGDPNQVAGWSCWLGQRPPTITPYYGQTTEVTCGAVSSLMALEQRGAAAFDPTSLVENRATELAFWRRATNLPACEPVGLAVETAVSGSTAGLFSALPRVILSTSEPVLLEAYTADDGERALRTDLQLESLRRSQELGIEIERRWINVDEIAKLVRGGDQVLLLIGLTELIGDPTPHWVLASAIIEDSLIISDPWVQAPNGETWVDTFALPIPLSTIDRITRWGEPAYRGVVVLPAAVSPSIAV